MKNIFLAASLCMISQASLAYEFDFKAYKCDLYKTYVDKNGSHRNQCGEVTLSTAEITNDSKTTASAYIPDCRDTVLTVIPPYIATLGRIDKRDSQKWFNSAPLVAASLGDPDSMPSKFKLGLYINNDGVSSIEAICVKTR